jgi:hypothetical protein
MIESTTFTKLNKYKNLYFNRVTDTLYEKHNNELREIKYGAIILKAENPTMSNEYPKEPIIIMGEVHGMDERLALMDAKVDSGQIACNVDNPEDCLNCGS